MNIIFNKEWKVRSKIWFETSKLKSIMYMMISQEWKENLDLLYNELEKSNSESELREKLWFELSNLESEVKNDNQTENNNWEQTNNNWNNNEQENNNKQENNNEQENNDELKNNDWSNWEQNENWSDNQDNISNMDETKIESLNDNENYIVNQAKLYWVTDNRQIAYILATVKWECGFKNIKEIWWEKRSYGKEWYYGRWYVQLTHKWNYKKFTNIIQKSWLNFKDNNWNILNWKTIDLVKNPDLILQSNDLAAFILVYWMRNWSFTWKKLDNYINNQKCDFKNARRIINWTDHADKFVWFAEDYLNKLWWKNKGLENNNEKLLIWPELLANNRDELWWLGSSIMVWIQWKNKSQFKNMDWIKSATTRNQDWFWKEWKKWELDKEKIKNYCNSKWIKSFLFYFWWNEAFSSVDAVNNAYNDIESMSKYLDSIGVQPVLCTCMWEKIEGHSVGWNWKIYPLADWSDWTPWFNNKIRNLWKEMNWPVMDFASIDNKIPKWSDKIHPNWSGYQIMRREIDKCLE
jgi:hypothetical protein